MIIEATDNTYTLDENRLMRIASAEGWVISCETGTLLVTQPGFNRDFVLRTGDNLRISTNGRVLVGGGTSARFKLGPPNTAPLFPRLIRDFVPMAVC